MKHPVPGQSCQDWLGAKAPRRETIDIAAIREKLAAAMSNLKVDTKGLRGGPIEWTKDNHFRTRQYYRVYRWDTGKGAIVRVKDWQAFDVK